MKTKRLGSFGSVTLPAFSTECLWLPAAGEMASIDQEGISTGTPALTLMERAASAVCAEVRRLGAGNRPVLVLCGPGNNGGDGLAVVRLLRDAGCPVRGVIVASKRYSPECLHQIAQCPDIALFSVDEHSHSLPDSLVGSTRIGPSELATFVGESGLIVDALLGTGQKSAPRGDIAAVIGALTDGLRSSAAARSAHPIVLAIDIPTGVDADTGALHDIHVKADLTVAIELVKRGCLQYPARAACGKIVCASIGLASRSGVRWRMYEGDAVEYSQPLSPDSHKGSRGAVFVIGGSAVMPGAPALSAHAALRAGAGLVTVAANRSWQGVTMPPEIMRELVESDESTFTADDCARLLDGSRSHSAVAIGPGLGTQPSVAAFSSAIFERLSNDDIPAVIDASALMHLAAQPRTFANAKVVMTPHPGEAAALLGCSTREVQQDRFAAADAIAAKYAATVLLKGAGTAIVSGNDRVVVARGTPALATAGSGDVLTGMIAALLASGRTPFSAAAFAAYCHAESGERAATRLNGSIVASDIIAEIPGVMALRSAVP